MGSTHVPHFGGDNAVNPMKILETAILVIALITGVKLGQKILS